MVQTGNYKKGFAGITSNKRVMAIIASMMIVGILFFSSPVAAYWIDSAISPIVERLSGGSQLNVTIAIGKVSDEIFDYSDVSAKLMYQDGTMGSAVSATNCSLTGTSSSYGYDFHGYGYGYDYSNGLGYGYQTGYGAGETKVSCMFAFDIKNGGVAVGVNDVRVHDVPLSNSSDSITGSTFIQFSDNKVYSYKSIAVGGATDSYVFNRQGEATPIMNVTIPAGVIVNGKSSGSFGISLDVIPPKGELDSSKVQGPVFLFGPAGTTFSPSLTLVIDYSLMTPTEQSAIESLSAAGNLEIRRCNDAGASCSNLAYSINTTTKTLTFSTDKFSTFAVYNGATIATTTATTSGYSSGGSGGGSVSGGTEYPPASKVTEVVPTPAPQQMPSQTIVPPTQPTQPVQPTNKAPEQTKVQEVGQTGEGVPTTPTVAALTFDGLLDNIPTGLIAVLGALGVVALAGVAGVAVYARMTKKKGL